VVASHVLVQRAVFAPDIMASTWRKGSVTLRRKKAKINANNFDKFVPRAGRRCSWLAGKQFCIPAGWHTGTWGEANARMAWRTLPAQDFIDKESWPSNSRDLNPLDYCVWEAVLDRGIQQVKSKITEHFWAEGSFAHNLG
jgi:hypothetical protein